MAKIDFFQFSLTVLNILITLAILNVNNHTAENASMLIILFNVSYADKAH